MKPGLHFTLPPAAPQKHQGSRDPPPTLGESLSTRRGASAQKTWWGVGGEPSTKQRPPGGEGRGGEGRAEVQTLENESSLGPRRWHFLLTTCSLGEGVPATDGM